LSCQQKTFRWRHCRWNLVSRLLFSSQKTVNGTVILLFFKAYIPRLRRWQLVTCTGWSRQLIFVFILYFERKAINLHNANLIMTIVWLLTRFSYRTL
jgi:hypothetical protein